MAQIRRPPRYRSPPPRHIPSLPHPVRIQPPARIKIRTIPSQPSNGHAFNNSEQSLFNFTSPNNPTMNQMEESIILPAILTENNEVLQRKHLPVYARFPFDLSRLPQPMEINVEDNIHKLRLRLIDSELHHQRRSTDEYIKRTHRIGMEDEPMNSLDADRELDSHRMPEIINQHRHRSNSQLITTSYSFEPRLQLQPLHEEQVYISSNIDDLIDSMARRHLAYRRVDATTDRLRRENNIDSLNTGRISGNNNRSSRNPVERDYVLTNPTDFNQRLRSRIDYYKRIQPEHNGTEHDDSIHDNSYKKLPPISSERDSNHLNPFKRDTSRLTLNEIKNHRSPSERSEHAIDLPSDIFLSARTRTDNSSPQSHKSQQRLVPKDLKLHSSIDEENEYPPSYRSQKNLKPDHEGFFTETHHPQRKRSRIARNKFRKIAMGVLFCVILQHRSGKTRPRRLQRSASARIHQIRLQEIIVALHRVYLEPDGPIFNTLIQAISSPISLDAALNKSSKDYPEAIQTIGNALTNIVARLTEFMPKDGVIGTGKLSALSALIQDGHIFPEKYFWQCEREFLEFNGSKVININKQRAILLLIGIFVFRALVTTLLVKPIKYRLILGQLKENQSVNLKVLASVMLYLGRRVAGNKTQVLAMPHEWQLSLYSDGNIRTIIEHSEMQSIIERCEHTLRMWCEEYIRRIDASVGNKFRH